MKSKLGASLFLCLSFFAGVPGRAAEPKVEAKDLPRLKPTDVTNVMGTFQIKKGFHLEVVASEPLVVSPIALSFDENGRMFVVEMRDYSELREVHPHLGTIRMLEDTNNDGTFDKATIYADDLPWPTGVTCYDGGIFVAASPDILYLKDTNGDGKADVRKVVFTGFGAGKEDKLNVQSLVNSLTWGMDNRLHGQTAGNGGMVVPGNNTNATPLDLRGRDFYFDPRTLEIHTEAGGGQYGMAFDNHGRRYVCSNSDHIQTFMYDGRYAERNSFYNMPPPRVSIAVDGPSAEVYRISPDEAWRVIRTKWRVAGLVSGPVEGGGRASGYFTGATGITIYRGDAWPEEFLGDAFICDCGSNLIHRKKVRPEGVALKAERPPDEQKVEFIASKDNWFRPVDLFNAPDGCLYVCDMYREVIEHPWSLPDSIKQFIDLNSGNDRGRIYRIAPDGFKPGRVVHLGDATTADLVATLEHSNGWHRDTAARLLYERRDKMAEPMLVRLAMTSKSPLARLHALHVMDGLGVLDERKLLGAMGDRDPFIREHAAKLSEKFLRDGTPSRTLWAALRTFANDSAINVRYQLALTLGEMKNPERIGALANISRRDADSVWTQAAILSSLAEGAGELFGLLAGDRQFLESGAGQEFLRQLAVLVAAKNQKEEMDDVIEFVSKVEEPAQAFAMTRALGEGLIRAQRPLAVLRDRLKSIFASAAQLAANARTNEVTRVEGIQLLGLTSFAESGNRLLSLLALNELQPIQLAAISALGHFAEPQVGTELTSRWNTLTPRLRREALRVLLARPERATALLNAIAAGTIRDSVLDSAQTKFLRNHSDKTVRQLAAKVLDSKPGTTRQEIVDSFMPALNLKGDAAHGKKIYEERCVSCHRLGGQGYALGPDLVTVKTTGKEKILVNVLDPNREVRPEFVSYVVDTKDDESYIGLIANETGASVTVRQAYGREDAVPRTRIAKMRSQGQSLMPEGLEDGLTPQDLADLIEYVEAAEEK